MKHALYRDYFREISKSRNRFLSIFAIILIGVSFFAGIKATGPDMKNTAAVYYQEHNLMDIKVVSTYGLNNDDIDSMKAVDGVTHMMPSYSVDALNTNTLDLIKVVSLPADPSSPDAINQYQLVEGRLPQNSGEAIIDGGTKRQGNSGHKVGDKISLSNDSADPLALDKTEYTIVGIVNSPQYITIERGTAAIGDGVVDYYIGIPEQDFNLDVYTEAYITIDAQGQDIYSQEYIDIIAQKQKELETVLEQRAPVRLNELKKGAQKEIDDGWQKIAVSETELNNAKATLDASLAKRTDGEAEYQRNLDQYNAEISLAEKKLASSKTELDQGEIEYQQGLQQYTDGFAAVSVQKAQMEGALSQLPETAEYAAQRAELLAGQRLIAQTEQDLADAKQQLDNARIGLDNGLVQYQAGMTKLSTNKTTGKQKLDEAKATLERGKTEYQNGLTEYESQKADADTTISDSKQKLIDSQQELDNLDAVSYHTFDRSINPGYTSYRDDADRMNSVAAVFPVFFILVAALVCLTTMTRMVEEQRTQIGTLKALGYSKVNIMGKYLVYATLSSLAGSVAGLVVGYNLFPTLIFNAYSMLYTLPPLIVSFHLNYAIISILAAFACTTLTAIAVSYSELKPMPAVLMRPKSPQAGKKILLEKIPFIWNKLSFIIKVTARNLFRYKKRMLMTIIGIAGCTALMLTGFGIKDSISGIASLQYEQIYQYDGLVAIDTATDQAKLDAFDKEVANHPSIQEFLYVSQETLDANGNERQQSINLVVPKDSQRLGEYIAFRDQNTLTLDDSGVIITKKLSTLMNVQKGDSITLIDSVNKKYTLPVAGVTEQYVTHYVYMTPTLYEQVFEESTEYNALYIKLADDSVQTEEHASTFLAKQDVVQQIVLYRGISQEFNRSIQSLNLVVLVLILSAAALAFVVLYNLTNINVSERMRELSTIKVLGFYDNEVSAYVYRENIFLTLIGILAGLVLGVFLHQFVISTVETDIVMFGRLIKPLSYVFSGLLTFAFSLVVNFAIHFKLKKINMVEALKSGE